MLLTEELSQSMERIRSMIRDLNGSMTELEQAFDHADLASKTADSEIKKKVDSAIESSKARKPAVA